MILSYIFIPIAVLAILWYIITTLRIYDFLRHKNIPVSFLLLRLFALQYANQYQEITRQENGKAGALYYHWIISINIALLAVILIIISNI